MIPELSVSDPSCLLTARMDGSGAPLLMLHGWGLNGAVFDGLVEQLSGCYRCLRPDLPGHGLDKDRVFVSFDAVVDKIAEITPDESMVFGWSLGGLVAAALAARYPHKVKRLIWVAGFARFIQSEDWPHAMQLETLQQFADSLEQDYQDTVSRFIALQFLGAKADRAAAQPLRDAVKALPPSLAGLRCGLDALRDVDIRDELASIQCPVRMIMGQRDRLVPVESVPDVLALLNDGKAKVIDGAGHAPFLSHPDEFLSALNEVLHD